MTQKRKRALTAKQLRFIDEYLVDFNATQAGKRAGYSKKTAGSQAFDLLKKPEIQEAIKAKQKNLAHKLGVTSEKIVMEAARIAFSDVRKLFDENGNLKPLHELDDDTVAALASVEVSEEYSGRGESREFVGYVKKIKLWDKNAALEKLMKYLGMFAKDNQQRSSDAIAALLAAIDGKSARLTVSEGNPRP